MVRSAACRISFSRRHRLKEPDAISPGDPNVSDAHGGGRTAQPVRDRTVAHPLALHHLDAAQTFPGDTPSAAPPPFLATERCHPASGIALLVAPNSAHRSGESPRNVRLLGEARLHQE